ncbi:hypothetical protein Pen02_78440 [Plantactinospora endophytica]|uniref:Uncharacterized protein n=1 Tax=Plantactinospora endophytica TaxID=673535 RepID=A0ABQ4EDU2_9ACTN|nr:hypothetical protein Pen02_78440 [Plantactinospora endophytica]
MVGGGSGSGSLANERISNRFPSSVDWPGAATGTPEDLRQDRQQPSTSMASRPTAWLATRVGALPEPYLDWSTYV